VDVRQRSLRFGERVLEFDAPLVVGALVDLLDLCGENIDRLLEPV
jgi:hypothetical protein